MTKIIRNQDFHVLAEISSRNGFREMFKNMLLSSNDPRLKLLNFDLKDALKVTPTSVSVREGRGEKCCHF